MIPQHHWLLRPVIFVLMICCTQAFKLSSKTNSFWKQERKINLVLINLKGDDKFDQFILKYFKKLREFLEEIYCFLVSYFHFIFWLQVCFIKEPFGFPNSFTVQLHFLIDHIVYLSVFPDPKCVCLNIVYENKHFMHHS